MHRKKSTEEMRKQSEESEKARDEIDRQIMATKLGVQRAKEIEAAKTAGQLQLNRAKMELLRKKQSEELQKSSEAANKDRRKQARKFAVKQLKERQHEEKTKAANEMDAKAKRVKAEKVRREKQSEEAKKQADLLRDLAAKRAKLPGRYCSCGATQVDFSRSNNWNSCPKGTLLTGLYRGNEDNLANIFYMQCCTPCDEAGQKPRTVDACEDANWVKKFNNEGWGECPKNTYLQGLYKSSCNHLSCIEYARCCRIEGSSGATECAADKSWTQKFSAGTRGWATIPANRFIQAWYRGSEQTLSNLLYPRTCAYFAHKAPKN